MGKYSSASFVMALIAAAGCSSSTTTSTDANDSTADTSTDVGNLDAETSDSVATDSSVGDSMRTDSAASDSGDSDASLDAEAGIPEGAQVTLALLESTDIHQTILSYDYYKLAPSLGIGFERMATLIDNARTQFANNVLLDDGDVIQGTPLGDYQALVNPVPCNQELAIYKVMDAFHYDVGTIGNHEFNYGLAYLAQVTGQVFNVDSTPAVGTTACSGPSFPLVLANVYSRKSRAPLYPPYTIVTKQFAGVDANQHAITVPVKIGVIGFTPPYITTWDARWLAGNVYTQGIVEQAERYIPEMRAAGADLVVVLSHGGLDNSEYDPGMENGNYWVSLAGRTDATQPPIFDAMLIGHSHLPFPNATSTVPQFNLPGVDKTKGLVNGIPTVMGNYWGSNLGVIKLVVNRTAGKWVVDTTQTTVECRSTLVSTTPSNTYVAADPTVAPLVAAENTGTIQYVETPIGTSSFELNTIFAAAGDVSGLEIVNQSQANYVTNYISSHSLSQYAGIPVLSVTAPFKSGYNGSTDFTDVVAGNVAINNAADLYLYANTIYAVKVSGSDIKNWLERAAGWFNQIDPTIAADQQLINPSFPGYNFDTFTSPSISYKIDVTQPAYDPTKPTVPGNRIVNLQYNGVPIDVNASFIVATNNYRAGGGGSFPGLDGTKTIIASADANRDVLIAYIKSTGTLTYAANGAAKSWGFVAPAAQAGRVIFFAAPNRADLITSEGIKGVKQEADAAQTNGNVTYSIDLTKQ